MTNEELMVREAMKTFWNSLIFGDADALVALVLLKDTVASEIDEHLDRLNEGSDDDNE